MYQDLPTPIGMMGHLHHQIIHNPPYQNLQVLIPLYHDLPTPIGMMGHSLPLVHIQLHNQIIHNIPPYQNLHIM